MDILNSEEYKKAQSDLDEIYRMAKDLDDYYKDHPDQRITSEPRNKNLEKWEKIFLECRFLFSNEQPHVVGELLGQWMKTKNTFFVDAIQVYCQTHKLTCGPLLMDEVNNAAKFRLEGHPAGTAQKVKKHSAENLTYNFMLNLIYRGVTLSDASRKAVTFYKRNFPALKPLKASVLDKNYVARHRKGEDIREDYYFKSWDRNKEIDHEGWLANERIWAQIIESIPLCDENDIGNRR